mgnify:CR=1 FL=1
MDPASISAYNFWLDFLINGDTNENPIAPSEVPTIVIESAPIDTPCESFSRKIASEFETNGRSQAYLLLLEEFIKDQNAAKFLISSIQAPGISDRVVMICNEDLKIIQSLENAKSNEYSARSWANNVIKRGFPYKGVYEMAGLPQDIAHQDSMNELHRKIQAEYQENGRSEKYVSLLKRHIQIEMRCIEKSHFIFCDSVYKNVFHDDLVCLQKVISLPCKTHADMAIKRGFPSDIINRLAGLESPLQHMVDEFKANGRSEKYLSHLQEFIKEQKSFYNFYFIIEKEYSDKAEKSCVEDLKLINNLLFMKGDGMFDKSYGIQAIEKGFPKSAIEALVGVSL